MENSKKIQIGLLGVIALLLVLNFTGAFDGLFGGADDAKSKAREALTTNVTADNSVTPANPANAAAAAPAVPTGPTTTVEFDESTYDYGTIDQGEKAVHIYKFKNTGSEPLVISNAKGSCGCTVPQWPKEPIAPGGTGEIEVAFDSKGKKGKQTKRVTITANTDPAQTFLTITGEVNAPEGAAAPTAITPATPGK